MKGFLNEIFQPYMPVIYKVMGLYAAVLAAVIVDLISGIRKSRSIGVKITHSYGLRKTLSKLARYYNLLIAVSVLDFAMIIAGIPQAHGLALIPYMTCMMTFIICMVEVYSVWEKDEEKGKYIEAAKIAKEVMQQDRIEEFADVIIKKLEEKENNK